MNRNSYPESIKSVLLRGVVHAGAGMSAALAGLWLPRTFFLIVLGVFAILFISLELLRFRSRYLNRWFCRIFRPFIRRVERKRITGASYVLTAAWLAFFLFPQPVAALAISFMAFGDSSATFFGKTFGKHRIYDGKTLEGSLACFSACVITAVVFISMGLPVPWSAALAGAAVATVAEGAPPVINDNLAIPILAGLMMSLLLL